MCSNVSYCTLRQEFPGSVQELLPCSYLVAQSEDIFLLVRIANAIHINKNAHRPCLLWCVVTCERVVYMCFRGAQESQCLSVVSYGEAIPWCLEEKLSFEMLTVRRQQHSISTHERTFLWMCQSFWNRKWLDLRGTRTPNLRIHAECSNHLSYQGQKFAVPCFLNTGSGGIYIYIYVYINIFDVNSIQVRHTDGCSCENVKVFATKNVLTWGELEPPNAIPWWLDRWNCVLIWNAISND